MAHLDLILRGASDPTAPFAERADGTRWTYADLLARAAAYGSALAGLGVRPGDRVAVQTEKSLEVLALYVGCLGAGAVYLPLNTAYTAGEIAYTSRWL